MKYEMKDFTEDVIKKSFNIPVLVDFWAEWCGPCKMLSPVLENLAEKFSGEWDLVKVDSDNNQEIAAQYGVKGIPNVKLFIDGNVVDEFTGALPEHKILSWLKNAIPGKNQKKIDNAIDLLSMGNDNEAKEILRSVITAEPQNEQATVIMAKAIFFEDPGQSINLISGYDGFSDYFETIDSLRTLKRLFDLKGNELPESEVKKKYFNAIEFIKKKDFDNALVNLIDVIRTDRSFDDDGARKACISVFKYLGEENETTLKHRKDFGSALYV